ncbi:uncharacterized protein LOC119736195 [Patiria miniata]|uniref:Uncharacterized protein n=1 Tax=Patiria miniata TaxID=46514 RepID=A0A914ARS2_PATMI|nr:uncharacterized protein LOC119736195 [Patiria miniata]
MSKNAELPYFGHTKRDNGYTVDIGSNATQTVYDDAFKDDATSSYWPLLDQVREATRTSSTPLQFFRKLHNIFLLSALCTILITLWPTIPVSMVVMGAVFIHDCPLEPKIPIYLLVTGACYFPRTLLDVVVRFCRPRHPEDEKSTMCRVTVALRRVQLFFLFVFMIVGNVWVYRNYSPSEDPDSVDYCYGPLYYFTFWLMTVTYIVIASGCLCMVVMTLCLIGSSFLEEKT